MSGTWASDWALNDIVTVAEFRKGMGCVADTTLGVAAASIDFTALPTTYAALVIVAYLRGDTAATNINTQMRFNNDSSGSYDTEHIINTAATTAGASETVAQTSGIVGTVPANTAVSGDFGSIVVWVPNYGNAVNHKTWLGIGSHRRAATTGNSFSVYGGGTWFAAPAAINRVTLFPSAGNFAAGSRLSVYVMGS